MHKVLALAFSTPLLLIGAAQPEPPPADAVQLSYRPCRPGPGDDRCIQLYERGVRTAYAHWRREQADGPRTELAMGGPIEPRVAAPHPAAAAPYCVEPPAAVEGDPPTEDNTRGM